MIKSQAEQEIESEKLDSPRPLDADIINDVEDDQDDVQNNNEEPQVLESSESGLLLQSQSFKNAGMMHGGKTSAHLELDFGQGAGVLPGEAVHKLNQKSKY